MGAIENTEKLSRLLDKIRGPINITGMNMNTDGNFSITGILRNIRTKYLLEDRLIKRIDVLQNKSKTLEDLKLYSNIKKIIHTEFNKET